MPYIRGFDASELDFYERRGLLSLPREEIEEKVKAGAKLTQRCSAFSDPGEDWTEVLLDGEVIAHSSGY